VKFKINAGAEFDTLTKSELDDGLKSFHTSWFQEMARGLKPMRFPAVLAPIAGGKIAAPAAGVGDLGPNPGFAWALQRITVFGLASGDTVQIFRNSSDGQNFIGQVSFATPWFHVGSAGFILKDGEQLAFSAAGLTATGNLIINGEFTEAPESMIWKLL
jgi:hypothetical protein